MIDFMASVQPIRKSGTEPIPIQAHAIDNLRYIRETMERAGSFTAVPGWGGVAMGLTALASAILASRQSTPGAWLETWLVEGSLASRPQILRHVAQGERRRGLPLWSAPARKSSSLVCSSLIARPYDEVTIVFISHADVRPRYRASG